VAPQKKSAENSLAIGASALSRRSNLVNTDTRTRVKTLVGNASWYDEQGGTISLYEKEEGRKFLKQTTSLLQRKDRDKGKKGMALEEKSDSPRRIPQGREGKASHR